MHESGHRGLWTPAISLSADDHVKEHENIPEIKVLQIQESNNHHKHPVRILNGFWTKTITSIMVLVAPFVILL